MRLTLTFDVDDKTPKFGLGPSELVAVFQQVMSTTGASETHKNCMLPMWLSASLKGDSRTAVAALSPLADMRWEWDWFDEWRRRFKAEKCQPYAWERTEREALRWPNSWHARRMLLLADTLSKTTYTRREFLQRQELNGYRHGWRFEHGGCVKSREIADEMREAVTIANWETWPPFFPGDSTIITADLPVKSKC